MRYKLLIGSALLCLLAGIAAFPGLFTRYPRAYRDILRSVEGPGGTSWHFAPEAPSAYYPFGTDVYGYDILTLVLWGLRWTLGCVLVVALSRTLIGSAVGVAKALLLKDGNHGIRASPTSVVPSFVFVFFLLFPVTINSPLGGVALFFYQCAAMTVFDLGGIMDSFGMKTDRLLKSPFVEAAASCGARPSWIARFHVLPFLAEDFLETFAAQTVGVLQLAGRLGVFSLFVGGTIMTFDPMILTSGSGELAGLIGLYRGRLQSGRWMLLYPLAAYLAVLLSLRLFVSGLHERLKKLPHPLP